MFFCRAFYLCLRRRREDSCRTTERGRRQRAIATKRRKQKTSSIPNFSLYPGHLHGPEISIDEQFLGGEDAALAKQRGVNCRQSQFCFLFNVRPTRPALRRSLRGPGQRRARQQRNERIGLAEACWQAEALSGGCKGPGGRIYDPFRIRPRLGCPIQGAPAVSLFCVRLSEASPFFWDPSAQARGMPLRQSLAGLRSRASAAGARGPPFALTP